MVTAILGTTLASAAADEGMQKLLERGRSLRYMLVCADQKRIVETGPRDAKDLAFVQEGAQANAPACLMLLARWNERGEGMPKDVKQAQMLFERAAALEVKGHVELGRMAEQGIVGAPSYAEAWDQYSQAAAKHDAAGLLALGRMTEQGLGRAANDRDAIEYYRRAAHRWDEQAWAQLDRLQTARGVLTSTEVDLERQYWRSLLASRAKNAYGDASALSAFQDYPYQVTLRFSFKRGQPTPSSVDIASPSKNPAFDHALRQATSTIRMPSAPIFGSGDTFEIDLPMHFFADTDRTPATK
jgi:hypothetical protein